MKYAFNAAVALGIAAVVPLAAAQRSSQSDRADHTKTTVSVTGCLQRNAPGKAAAGATTTTTTPSTTTGTAGTSGGEQFVLIKAAPGPSGTGTWQSSTPKGPWYFVVGDSARLRKDDNHLVEVTGTLDTTGSVVGTSASSTDGPSGTIHARTIKVVNAGCKQ